MRSFVLWILIVASLFASVDINNADAKSFSTLKGVGAKKAQAIVAYRDEHGCFSSIESLSSVKGIGSKTVEKNKTQLTLGKCKK